MSSVWRLGAIAPVTVWTVESLSEIGGHFIIFTVGSPAIPTDLVAYPDFKILTGTLVDQSTGFLSRDVANRGLHPVPKTPS